MHQHHSPSAVSGAKVLVVEDETIVSFLLEDMLVELGCAEVWHAANINAATDILNGRRPDVAVLDVNLSGVWVFPLAERLEGAEIPFIFSTGYGSGGMPQRWCDVPVLQKPFAVWSLASALKTALLRRGHDHLPSSEGSAVSPNSAKAPR